MRCVCCDRILSATELKKKKLDGTFEDLCGSCLRLSRETLWESEKVLANLTELPFLFNNLSTKDYY